MLKMQNDELEQSALTFQPKLSAYAENAKSALQLNNDPSYFLDWFVTILLTFGSCFGIFVVLVVVVAVVIKVVVVAVAVAVLVVVV